MKLQISPKRPILLNNFKKTSNLSNAYPSLISLYQHTTLSYLSQTQMKTDHDVGIENLGRSPLYSLFDLWVSISSPLIAIPFIVLHVYLTSLLRKLFHPKLILACKTKADLVALLSGKQCQSKRKNVFGRSIDNLQNKFHF